MQHDTHGVSSDTAPRLLSPATGYEDFSAAPINRYATGTGWLAFARAEFSGLVLWGRLDAKVVRDLVALLPCRCSPVTKPHPSILDTRLLESVDPDALTVREEFLTEHVASLSSFITRLAVLHPPGLMGVIGMGLRAMAPPPFPEEFFVDLAEALAWLERESERSVLEEVDLLRTEAVGITPLLQELRGMLAERRRLPLHDAARALGLSDRSLQRKLAAAGTSYQEELTLATVRLAQQLLLAPGATVAGVAFDVGCASPQHLNTLFRKVVGETTTGWRDRQRDGAAR
jgi:AraC-like DNA-binding protein